MNPPKTAKLSLLFYTFIVSALLVLGFAALYPPETQAEITLDDQEREFIQNINDYRESKGLDPLKISSDLSKAALSMAEDMAANPDSINHEHKDSKGRLPAERAGLFGYTDGVGENLAAGYQTADRVFDAWKGSTEHKENMVYKDYAVMGIARVTTSNNFKWYWVNMFGDKEHKNDLVDEASYSPLIKMQVKVTDPNGKPVNKAKVSVLNKNKHKIDGGKTNTKGKQSFTLEPKDEFYVRASATGYKSYTKRVKPGDKDSVTVNLWLEKE